MFIIKSAWGLNAALNAEGRLPFPNHTAPSMINDGPRREPMDVQVSARLQVVDTESNHQWYLYNGIMVRGRRGPGASYYRRTGAAWERCVVAWVVRAWCPELYADPSLDHCKRRSNCPARTPDLAPLLLKFRSSRRQGGFTARRNLYADGDESISWNGTPSINKFCLLLANVIKCSMGWSTDVLWAVLQ